MLQKCFIILITLLKAAGMSIKNTAPIAFDLVEHDCGFIDANDCIILDITKSVDYLKPKHAIVKVMTDAGAIKYGYEVNGVINDPMRKGVIEGKIIQRWKYE